MEQHQSLRLSRSRLLLLVMLSTILVGGCDSKPRQIPVLSERQRYEPLLEAIDRAESIKDPLQRCLATPSPPHLEWPADMVEAFCRDQFTPVAQADVVRRMIDRKDWQGLDAHYSNYLKRHFSGQDPEYLLYRAFPYASWRSDDEARRYSRRWQQAQPGNAFANMLLAKQIVRQAWQVRGNGYIKDVDPKNLDRAIKLAREASILALKAIKSEPRLMPAYSTLIDSYMLGGESKLMHLALRSALRQSPHSYYIRSDAAIYMQLKWGGTPEQLERLSQQAEKSLSHNPRLRVLRGAADAERATMRWHAKRLGPALALMRESLEAGPNWNTLYDAASLSDVVGYESESLIYLTQRIRFERDRRDSLLYRGGIWELGGWYSRSLRDYRAAQVFTPDDEAIAKHIARVEALIRRKSSRK